MIHFDIAVALFLICDIILGKHYDLKTVLLAFTGWTSIGNSNWYIFAVIILYFIVLLSFTVFKKKQDGRVYNDYCADGYVCYDNSQKTRLLLQHGDMLSAGYAVRTVKREN